MPRKQRTDQRKYKRLRAQDGAFVDLKTSPIKIGKIVDISRGGLAFRYLQVGQRLREAFELDMYSRHNDFRMEKVPVKTIWDRQTAGELSFSARTRLRGVQFGKLTQNQFSELERFLLLNTVTEEERPGTIH
jgi:PilZ domain